MPSPSAERSVHRSDPQLVGRGKVELSAALKHLALLPRFPGDSGRFWAQKAALCPLVATGSRGTLWGDARVLHSLRRQRSKGRGVLVCDEDIHGERARLEACDRSTHLPARIHPQRQERGGSSRGATPLWPSPHVGVQAGLQRPESGRVGRRDPRENEGGPFLVCTHNRGFVRGEPILVGIDEVYKVVYSTAAVPSTAA
jgi:hypothetical protein